MKRFFPRAWKFCQGLSQWILLNCIYSLSVCHSMSRGITETQSTDCASLTFYFPSTFSKRRSRSSAANYSPAGAANQTGTGLHTQSHCLEWSSAQASEFYLCLLLDAVFRLQVCSASQTSTGALLRPWSQSEGPVVVHTGSKFSSKVCLKPFFSLKKKKKKGRVFCQFKNTILAFCLQRPMHDSNVLQIFTVYRSLFGASFHEGPSKPKWEGSVDVATSKTLMSSQVLFELKAEKSSQARKALSILPKFQRKMLFFFSS